MASTDGHFEVFISPRLTDSVTILGVLIHELIHAAVGTKAKHGKLFKQPAVAVGLEGKMTATTVGEALRETFKQWIAEHGDYPAGGLNLNERKKQTTRMLKCDCELCGYTVRTAAKWLAEYGPPLCPNPEHSGEIMRAEMPEDDDDEPLPPPPPKPKPERKPKPEPKPKAPKAPKPEKPAKAVPEAPKPPAEAPKPAPKPPKAKERASAPSPAPKPASASFRVSTPEDDAWGTFGTDLKAAKQAARKQSKEGERIASVVASDTSGQELGRYVFNGGLFTHTQGDFQWP
jgi:hypothetical protein